MLLTKLDIIWYFGRKVEGREEQGLAVGLPAGGASMSVGGADRAMTKLSQLQIQG